MLGACGRSCVLVVAFHHRKEPRHSLHPFPLSRCCVYPILCRIKRGHRYFFHTPPAIIPIVISIIKIYLSVQLTVQSLSHTDELRIAKMVK